MKANRNTGRFLDRASLRKGLIFKNSQDRRGLHRRNYGNKPVRGKSALWVGFYNGTHGKYLNACDREKLRSYLCFRKTSLESVLGNL